MGTATSRLPPNRVERLLLLLAGGLLACAAPLAAPPPPPDARAPTGPAFVVYTSRDTLVVPIALGAPSATASGIWVLDDTGPRPTVRVRLTDVLAELPDCAIEPAPARPCGEGPMRFTDGPVCDCWRVTSDEADDTTIEEEGGLGEDEPCWTSGTSPAALVGGVLYELGTSHSTCGGMNVYDAIGVAVAMVDAPFDPLSFRSLLGPRGCTVDVPAGEPAPVSDRDRLECPGPGGDAEAGDPERCDDCSRLTPETDTWLLSRGRLVRVENNIYHAGGARWVSDVRVGPARCPTAADPCGPSALYPGITDASDYWIATDGSAALARDGGRARVLRPGRPQLAAFELPAEVIGVRFHRDVGALVRAMREGVP